MALRRDLTYDGRYQAATNEQPQGAFKNRTSNTSEDGSYLAAGWCNDWSALFSSLLVNAGITPNNVIDQVGASQYYDALEIIINSQLAGCRLEFNSSNVPSYAVHANGQELSRTTDDVLWNFAQNSGLVIAQSTKDSDVVTYAMYWGDGDGSTTFTVPNWHLGHFARGNPTGVNVGDVQGDAIRNITGSITNTSGDEGVSFSSPDQTQSVGALELTNEILNSVGGTVQNTASNTLEFDASKIVPVADENRPKTGNVLVCIHRGKI